MQWNDKPLFLGVLIDNTSGNFTNFSHFSQLVKYLLLLSTKILDKFHLSATSSWMKSRATHAELTFSISLVFLKDPRTCTGKKATNMRASKLTLIPWPFLGNVYVLLLMNQFNLFSLLETFFLYMTSFLRSLQSEPL